VTSADADQLRDCKALLVLTDVSERVTATVPDIYLYVYDHICCVWWCYS